MCNYENLDNHQTGIHDYFKFIKYGFGRATDIASMHVRRDRLQRADALELVKRHDGKFPWTYLGKPIEEMLANIDMSFDEFMGVCDRFTNKRLFETDRRGELVRDDRMELTKINDDNVELSVRWTGGRAGEHGRRRSSTTGCAISTRSGARSKRWAPGPT